MIRKKRRVLMVLDGPYPPDPRVETEAIALADAGFEVMLFCLKKNNSRPSEESASFGQVRRALISPLMHKLSALAYTVPLYHNWLAAKMRPVMEAFRPHVVHIHDMQSARGVFGAISGLAKNPKVVLDLHENRPEIMRHYHHVNTLQGRLLISPAAWKRAEERYVNRADAVFVVTPEAKAELQNRPNIAQDWVFVMPNTVSRQYALSAATLPEAESKMVGKQNILYLGDTGKRRGIETAIRAMAILRDDFPLAQLVLVGKSKSDDEYAALAASLGIADRLIQEGWRFADLFPAYLRLAQVGISPLHRNIHHDTTYANKLFQYMAFGVPMVVSDCPPQVRIVRDHDCGLHHPALDHPAMADCIRQLLSNSEFAQRLGQNGKKAIESTLCRENQTTELVDCYRLLTGEPLD